MRTLYVFAAILIAVLLFVACGGGGSEAQNGQSVNGSPHPSDGGERQTLNLDISSQALGEGSYRVLLHGRSARDLYQIAGSLLYDPALYTIELVEAGGGLGGPEDSYFIDSENSPGSLDFAYTKRWYGSGVDGDPLLMSLRVRPVSAFNEADFSIDTTPGRLKIRDSHKTDLPVRCEGLEAGNE